MNALKNNDFDWNYVVLMVLMMRGEKTNFLLMIQREKNVVFYFGIIFQWTTEFKKVVTRH